MNMICLQCGTENDSSIGYCTNCQYDLQTKQNPQALPPFPVNDQSQVFGNPQAPGQQNNYGQQQPCGQQPYYFAPYPYVEPASSSATGSLVCGLIGFFMTFACYFLPVGLILGIIAIVMGRKARKAGNTGGIATAGFVTGIISLVINALIMILIVAVIFIFIIMGNSYQSYYY